MASGKMLRQLIKSGVKGDSDAFRAASEAVIKEERHKNHHLLANDLERLLYGDQSKLVNKGKNLSSISSSPLNKDNGLPLLEERAVVREDKDLILSDTAQSALDEILIEHTRGDVLRSYGLQPAQKLLFCGPPGCGKTLAAEVIAHSLSMPLVLVRLDSVISSFLGETASNLRKVFDYISAQPVVVLFDEFDALTKDRGDSADHGELKRSVNAVLQMMDSYRGESILIATTNYESLLDKAVWRRFDEVVNFEMPNLEQIKRLLTLKLSGVRRNFEADDNKISSLFKGMSHADIERVLRRSIKEMILANREFLEKKHLDMALAREYHRNS
ncbi:AAA family ATPase [Desulfuromonas acetoxidans]|uniref:AAA ATPase, central region n=1 Tax=Desulfuromonas acetoxidans (strain DSM 684 / 11070) TaxID=281689 RepID=Q1JWT8_DESA6|nr:AAA family ATPase [Desulfuromonas acetoxidans]EAT14706.1 AAA ATPase, central region [Desulfuromonas acetoxidans DSM 684]MBF0646296.1 AAA family ATPase [Desulfuromonas acetoxidans]NVD25104.1 AAA family ATPase [Desulfuromonas acetoxidans]NVE17275.1 AAA family ATPase [Desulfuromonas acetoxidans]